MFYEMMTKEKKIKERCSFVPYRNLVFLIFYQSSDSDIFMTTKFSFLQILA